LFGKKRKNEGKKKEKRTANRKKEDKEEKIPGNAQGTNETVAGAMKKKKAGEGVKELDAEGKVKEWRKSRKMEQQTQTEKRKGIQKGERKRK